MAAIRAGLARDMGAQQEVVAGAVRGEVRRALQASTSESAAAVARLDTRLAVSGKGEGEGGRERQLGTPGLVHWVAAHCEGVIPVGSLGV
jgi:hypothetical protein